MALSNNLTNEFVGTEGSTYTNSLLVGQKILLLHLGDKLLYQVTSSPTVNDFVFDPVTGQLTFGKDVDEGQVLQIVYRAI